MTAKNSQHSHGKAADFKLYVRSTNKQIDPTETYDYLNFKHKNQVALGLYVNRVHVDNRDKAGQRFGIKR